MRLDRTMAWCLRFGYNCRHQKIKKRRLNARRDGCRPDGIHQTRSRHSFPAGIATLEKEPARTRQLETKAIQSVRGRQKIRHTTSRKKFEECTNRLRNLAPSLFASRSAINVVHFRRFSSFSPFYRRLVFVQHRRHFPINMWSTCSKDCTSPGCRLYFETLYESWNSLPVVRKSKIVAKFNNSQSLVPSSSSFQSLPPSFFRLKWSSAINQSNSSPPK